MARKESRQARAARSEAIFERLAAANPAPKGELQYINPFTLLVAVVLSAQATDAGVNKATPALFAIADTPEKMAAFGEERLAERIRTIGLYRTKARNIIALSRAIVERHGGETPRNREELEALPGVGRKTANVVLNTVFGEPTLAVDTHVFRVANRLAIAPGKTPREVEDGPDARRSGPVPAARPSLADPAWALHLHGPQAVVRRLRLRRSLPVRTEKPAHSRRLMRASAPGDGTRAGYGRPSRAPGLDFRGRKRTRTLPLGAATG